MSVKALKSQLREKVKGISNSALDILANCLDGKKPVGSGMMDKLIRIVSQGIKVEHMDQLKDQNDRSFALRLLPYLPKDNNARKNYIMLSNPSLKPLLEDKPRKEKTE